MNDEARMELKEFVTMTLVQIMEGVDEAIKQNTSGTGIISPAYLHPGEKVGWRESKPVQFDVALTVAGTSVKEGKAGISVAFAKLGVGGEVSTEHTAVSRIKFTVPVVIPVTPTPSPNEE